MCSKTAAILKISQPFQNVRLLELPDDLLNMITSSEHDAQPLTLTSSPGIEDSDEAQQGNLHLCSQEKIWLVKQVSTSNSVYVTRPTQPNKEIIAAFAKPSSILELHPVKATDYESTTRAHLRRLLPTIMHPSQTANRSQYSKAQLYDEIPAPMNIITKAIGQSCVFSYPWSMRDDMNTTSNSPQQGVKAYIPSPSLLLDTWRNIVEAATISETKIVGDLEADMLLEAFGDAEGSVSEFQNVLKSVAKAMFERHGYFETLGIIVRSSKLGVQDTLNQMDLARWVGNTVLRVAELEGKTSIEKESFETQWEDTVPAYLSKYCSVEVLGRSCNVQHDGDKNLVEWREFNVASKEVGDIGLAAKVVASDSKGKRKWHDKFAATRTAKR